MIPQLLHLRQGGSHADQPDCHAMATSSPYSPAFARARLAADRRALLWFGGHPGHGDARTELFRRFRGASGFELYSTREAHSDTKRRDAVNMTLSSKFCFVPRGQGQGDPTRHMVAIFHGCVPVFTLGRSGADDALPFEEVLPWGRFSLRVPVDRMAALPAALHAADEPEALRTMRSELSCAWRALFWSSVVGSCFGEPLHGDAFDTLMTVLRRRLVPPALRRHLAHVGGAGLCARPGNSPARRRARASAGVRSGAP